MGDLQAERNSGRLCSRLIYVCPALPPVLLDVVRAAVPPVVVHFPPEYKLGVIDQCRGGRTRSTTVRVGSNAAQKYDKINVLLLASHLCTISMNVYIPRAPAALARRRAPRVEVPVRSAQPSAHAAAVARVVAVVAVAAAVAAALGRRRVQRSLRAPQGMRGGAAAFKESAKPIDRALARDVARS